MDQPLSHRPPAAARPVDAFDTLAAWRPPEPRHPRFGVANDGPSAHDAPDGEQWRWGDPISPHVIAVGGALAFAVIGAVLGSALHL